MQKFVAGLLIGIYVGIVLARMIAPPAADDPPPVDRQRQADPTTRTTDPPCTDPP